MNYFLSIGCDEYKYREDLFFCTADSTRMFEVFTNFCNYDKNASRIITPYIGDTDNTSENIIKTISSLCSSLTNQDTLLFFFAGHGMQTDQDVLLLLPDYDDGIDNAALSLSTIQTIFSKSQGFCFSIIDACHSGKELKPIDWSLTPISQERGWAILASCAGNELSYPYPEKEQGAFSFFLSNCIENWCLNSNITLEELKNKVCDLMIGWCAENDKIQHPTINGSIIGKQIIAVRNNKPGKNNISITPPASTPIEGQLKMNDLVKTDYTHTLWNALEGLNLPKNADVPLILESNSKLQIRTINSLKRNYESEDYESISEIIWERSIEILRKRILSLGAEFVGEMIGLDNDKYIQELPAFEVINLAAELGFIDATGKMRLNQANELVLHYRNTDVVEEMPRNEIETIVRACVQYITGYDDASLSFEFSDFRNSLKRESFSEAKLELLHQSPYFYKKTTLRTLFNLLNSTEGAEYDIVANNFVSIIVSLWNSFSSDDRYLVGMNYSRYVNNGDKKHAETYKYALEKVRGYDYVPENLRSISYIQMAKNLKNVHHAIDNFYNEPSAAKKLEQLGTTIPRPAIKECVSACLLCLTGNPYGVSDSAIEVLKRILNKLDKNAWIFYLEECLPYDEDFLLNISVGDYRIKRWCKIVQEYELTSLNLKVHIPLQR